MQEALKSPKCRQSELWKQWIKHVCHTRRRILRPDDQLYPAIRVGRMPVRVDVKWPTRALRYSAEPLEWPCAVPVSRQRTGNKKRSGLRGTTTGPRIQTPPSAFLSFETRPPITGRDNWGGSEGPRIYIRQQNASLCVCSRSIATLSGKKSLSQRR